MKKEKYNLRAFPRLTAQAPVVIDQTEAILEKISSKLGLSVFR